jgi:hypothetical protein
MRCAAFLASCDRATGLNHDTEPSAAGNSRPRWAVDRFMKLEDHSCRPPPLLAAAPELVVRRMMRTTLLTIVTLTVLVGCKSPPTYVEPVRRDGYYDFTIGQSPTCEVHHVEMSPKLVKLEFGLTAPTDMSRARRKSFPHADEPYDTGYCLPFGETQGSVFVCPRCTKARTTWLSRHKTAQK